MSVDHPVRLRSQGVWEPMLRVVVDAEIEVEASPKTSVV